MGRGERVKRRQHTVKLLVEVKCVYSATMKLSALRIMPTADFTAQQIANLVRLDELHLRK